MPVPPESGRGGFFVMEAVPWVFGRFEHFLIDAAGNSSDCYADRTELRYGHDISNFAIAKNLQN
ncbi:hypothetical protein R3X27_25100, partial [Tropicimonas sp. TH_r6]|uniref:hypothetical protein n=1 Tax=Tropicimonas sp. TH_r6 TaxID=3082085 RepID=UPI002953ABC5